MTTIPQPKTTIATLIDAAHEARQEPPRPHLGASMLGHHCPRWLWLSYRWAVQEQFPGRIKRLFRRGEREEETIVSDLRAIGIDVRAPKDQDRVSFGAHVSGSMDGIAESGVPEAPKKRHVLEFKSHNKKSFDDLERKGLKDSKPVHWAQCQVYMLGSGIDRALYVAVCKDDDRLYTERVRLEPEEARKLVDRGRSIALSDRLPEPCPGASPDWYLCKFCAGWDFCHGGQPTQHANCRTCAHSTSREDDWHCARWDAPIPTGAQREGCPSHVLHPDLVPWRRVPTDSETSATYLIDGKEVVNGEGGFESSEILANPAACASGDKMIARFRHDFGARVDG